MPEPKSNEKLIRAVWDEARDLIKRLEGSTVQRFSVEAGDTKIEIERGMPGGVVAGPAPVAAGVSGGGAVQEAPAAPEADLGHPLLAPLVGTFYRASQPGSPPFVQEGDTVDEGQVVAIVEAMKLMNQVVADRAGKIGKVVAEEGAWVEFEQVLMYLEPAEEE